METVGIPVGGSDFVGRTDLGRRNWNRAVSGLQEKKNKEQAAAVWRKDGLKKRNTHGV